MVESRPDSEFKTALQAAPRNGLVDGFPIKVYLNGNFHGIYTWNIPKDGWMFAMDDENPNHVVLCAEKNTDGDEATYGTNSCQFKELWGGEEDDDWSVEFGEASEAIVTSFNEAIDSVMNFDATKFQQKFDLDSLIDYYIFSDFCVHLDGLAKNMLMVTYDGQKWGASLSDMDSTFGAWWDGTSFVATDYSCPDQYQEPYSLLWQVLVANFPYQLKKRYFELRDGALSLANLVTYVEDFYNSIPTATFTDEHTKWPNLPCVDTNTVARFREYMSARAAVIDAKYAAIEFKAYPHFTGVENENLTLNLTDNTPQTIDWYLTDDYGNIVDPTLFTGSISWSVEPGLRGKARFCDVINGN